MWGDGALRAPSVAPCGADWIPAYAGMTRHGGRALSLAGVSSTLSSRPTPATSPLLRRGGCEVPAYAGMTVMGAGMVRQMGVARWGASLQD